MDVREAWVKTRVGIKTARSFSADRVNGGRERTGRILDGAAPTFAPLTARWDAEADRRKKLRTPENLKALIDAQKAHNSARQLASKAGTERKKARKENGNPLALARRSARTADRAATRGVKSSKADLKSAKADYPSTLASLAVRVHVAHIVPAGIATYALSTTQDWTTWPAWLSAGLVAGHAAVLKVGRRQVVAVVADESASAEERQLMERLDPSYWVEHAKDRKLAGTVTTPPQITPAGVVCGVRLDGEWTLPDLRGKADNIRALLGMRTETRMEVTKGARGDWARLVIRTRSAADGVSMIWSPEHEGIGVDEVTGEFVDLPLAPGTHILLAGITGMGKSVSWRPLVMRAHLADEWAVVLVDPKRQEAIGWQHCLRCVGQETNREKRMADIYGMAHELTQEMHRRQGIAKGPVWVPDGKPENRKLLVVIDEGAAIVRMANQKQYADVMDLFEELWSEARSVGFQFVWATQFPTKSVGVPAAVKENMSARLSLTVNAGEAERAIFGENAQQTGWTPSRLDGIPGRAMLQYGKRKADPLRLWHVTDDVIASLPKADPWQGPSVAEAPDPGGRKLTLVKDAPASATSAGEVPAPREAEAAAAPAGVTNRDRVLAAVADGARTGRDITDRTELHKGTVSKVVKQLLAEGAIVRQADGMLTVGEVSA